jgi:transcriptional regulator with XRE-family HTH domain
MSGPSTGSSLPDEDNAMQPVLGQRLRAIRMARGFSLAEVSRETNISRSFLSLVEKGQNEITIGRLVRLVGFYGVHASDFFAYLEGTSRNIVRREDRRNIPSPQEHMEIHLLAPDDERTMLPMSVDFEPGGGLAEMGRHGGEEFIHVLEGEVILQLEGDEPVVLRTGDTAWYSGEQGHSLTNATDGLARLIAVMSPPNL